MFGINNNTHTPPIQVDSLQPASTDAPKRASVAQTSGSAIDSDQTVKVSSTAGALAQITGQSDVRQEKVAQLQAAIASGTYNVSSTDVADKLIHSMLTGR